MISVRAAQGQLRIIEFGLGPAGILPVIAQARNISPSLFGTD